MGSPVGKRKPKVESIARCFPGGPLGSRLIRSLGKYVGLNHRGSDRDREGSRAYNSQGADQGRLCSRLQRCLIRSPCRWLCPPMKWGAGSWEGSGGTRLSHSKQDCRQERGSGKQFGVDKVEEDEERGSKCLLGSGGKIWQPLTKLKGNI